PAFSLWVGADDSPQSNIVFISSRAKRKSFDVLAFMGSTPRLKEGQLRLSQEQAICRVGRTHAIVKLCIRGVANTVRRVSGLSRLRVGDAASITTQVFLLLAHGGFGVAFANQNTQLIVLTSVEARWLLDGGGSMFSEAKGQITSQCATSVGTILNK